MDVGDILAELRTIGALEARVKAQIAEARESDVSPVELPPPVPVPVSKDTLQVLRDALAALDTAREAISGLLEGGVSVPQKPTKRHAKRFEKSLRKRAPEPKAAVVPAVPVPVVAAAVETSSDEGVSSLEEARKRAIARIRGDTKDVEAAVAAEPDADLPYVGQFHVKPGPRAEIAG